MTVGLAIGLLDVLVFHIDAISSQKTVSAGVDLGLGLFLLAVGALVATGRLHGRRKAPVPARDGPPDKPQQEKKDGWARLLTEPRFGLAMLIGAVCGTPGASYLTGLHILVTSKSSTANQVVGVVLFVLIEFLLIIIPFAFLELRPEATKARLTGTQAWCWATPGSSWPTPRSSWAPTRPSVAWYAWADRVAATRQHLRRGPASMRRTGPGLPHAARRSPGCPISASSSHRGAGLSPFIPLGRCRSRLDHDGVGEDSGTGGHHDASGRRYASRSAGTRCQRQLTGWLPRGMIQRRS
jgi:hypothetical protein